MVVRGSSCILKSLVKVVPAPKTSKCRKHFNGRSVEKNLDFQVGLDLAVDGSAWCEALCVLL